MIWYRRTTVAARILALFLAFLIPTLLLYPAMNFFAERATRELIATEYAVQAQNHVQTLLALCGAGAEGNRRGSMPCPTSSGTSWPRFRRLIPPRRFWSGSRPCSLASG